MASRSTRRPGPRSSASPSGRASGLPLTRCQGQTCVRQDPPRVQPLPHERRREVGGVAEQEDPAAAPPVGDPGPEGARRLPYDPEVARGGVSGDVDPGRNELTQPFVVEFLPVPQPELPAVAVLADPPGDAPRVSRALFRCPARVPRAPLPERSRLLPGRCPWPIARTRRAPPHAPRPPPRPPAGPPSCRPSGAPAGPRGRSSFRRP